MARDFLNSRAHETQSPIHDSIKAATPGAEPRPPWRLGISMASCDSEISPVGVVAVVTPLKRSPVCRSDRRLGVFVIVLLQNTVDAMDVPNQEWESALP